MLFIKKLLPSIFILGMFIFSGCASMHSNALDPSTTLPKEDGYKTFTKLIKMDDKEVTKKLLKMRLMMKSAEKTERSRNINSAAAFLAKRSQYRKSFSKAYYHDLILANKLSVSVEPSEIVEIKDSIFNPSYKKVSIELQEYDVINGCKNAVKKLFTGFEKRFLYYGAIKQGDGWLFYITYTGMKQQETMPGDKCTHDFFIGTEAHSTLLVGILKKYINELKPIS